MEHIIAFFSHPFFAVFGGISSLVVLATFFYSVFLFSQGVIPVLWRLGNGLSSRKIAVFADEKYDDLKGILVDSGLFRDRNILRIDKDSIDKAKNISLLLMHWDAYKGSFNDILGIKDDTDALIVYAPQNEGPIEEIDRDTLNKKRNAIIVNFRGRLLNDVLTSMITTGYRQK